MSDAVKLLTWYSAYTLTISVKRVWNFFWKVLLSLFEFLWIKMLKKTHIFFGFPFFFCFYSFSHCWRIWEKAFFLHINVNLIRSHKKFKNFSTRRIFFFFLKNTSSRNWSNEKYGEKEIESDVCCIHFSEYHLFVVVFLLQRRFFFSTRFSWRSHLVVVLNTNEKMFPSLSH